LPIPDFARGAASRRVASACFLRDSGSSEWADEDYRDVGKPGSKTRQENEPIGVGHCLVEDDGARWLTIVDASQVAVIEAGDHAVSGTLQYVAQQPPQGGIVLDEEHPHVPSGCPQRACHPRDA
jgi:hypothetical protein